ncbi:phBC6A51 family helix-turn-helix protein [Siminovitchia sp. FSL H7-0308]|uniref:phBC6A51 family helix-turn-helix protein n=1 Tax=Siminovitchia sp. FSL H7-0308 TaxID=2921432 RepID=UPI0030EC51D4
MEITFDELKQRLKPGQRLAAELIVQNDFAPKGEKMTLEQIAEQVGVTDRQLYNWRQDADFTRYMSAISDNKLDNYRSLADSQLIKLIQGTSNNGVASIKALELFYKLNGRMQDKQTVVMTDNRKPTYSRDEISRGLAELNKYVN